MQLGGHALSVVGAAKAIEMAPVPTDAAASDREVWAHATTFQQLCAVNARFVDRKLSFSPLHGEGAIDAEADAIAPFLVQLNRRGLLTTGSQPGGTWPKHRGRQRAWVEGFAMKATALGLYEKALYTELDIRIWEPGTHSDGSAPITQQDGHPFTNVGPPDWEALEHFGAVCGPDAMGELRTAWYVVVTDPRWGRRNYLWREILGPSLKGYSVRPHPDLGLENIEY